MRQLALRQAHDRLNKARAAVANLREFSSFKKFQEDWIDFLMAAATIYSKLEQGAKSVGKNEAWFGRKKYDRKNDQLLDYIHHARNVEEHGIDGTSSLRMDVKIIEGGADRIGIKIDEENMDVSPILENPKDGTKISVTKFLILKFVIDRGIKYNPPAIHLGKQMYDDGRTDEIELFRVAELGLNYLEHLVAEADQLSQTP